MKTNYQNMNKPFERIERISNASFSVSKVFSILKFLVRIKFDYFIIKFAIIRIQSKINKLSFEETKNIEKKYNSYRDNLLVNVEKCESCSNSTCKILTIKVSPYHQYFKLFNKAANKLHKSYHLNASDIFKNKKEFEKYVKSMSCFNDILDYETPIEDEKYIFELNKL